MGIIKEFRVIMPMTVEEYQIAQLWSVANTSKQETGGGEGVEVLQNEPFDNPTEQPLYNNDPAYTKGQFTHKIYYLSSKVPAFVRLLAPKGMLEFHEKAWNSYPYCRTVITNSYMEDKFELRIETMHIQDKTDLPNVHQLSDEELEKREVIYIDIADNSVISDVDYKDRYDPSRYVSTKTGRGPLVGSKWWQDTNMPIMCAYKLVKCEFKWFGLQTRVENLIAREERRLFTNFHRQVFCSTDEWFGLTMADIRKIEDDTKNELDQLRSGGEATGMKIME